MTNNETFKTILHLLGVGRNKELIEELFRLGGIKATQSKIKAWRTDVDNVRSSHMPDAVLRAFFQGLFLYRDSQLSLGREVFNFPITNF